MNGGLPPAVRTSIPGPRSSQLVDVLARHECPAITARRTRRADMLGTASDDPIVWESALGANVVDVDGNRYVDLTSGFGVTLLGHRHPDVMSAAQGQSERLVHAMGDAWPDRTRIALLDRLAQITPDGLDVTILGLSGSDAVDATVKTAALATGRPGVITFERAYHGLALGVCALQGYKSAFIEPFRSITHPAVTHLPWGCSMETLDAALTGEVGLVLAEPIQGRGGIRIAPAGWLSDVAEHARRAGALFAFDEIQTGLGRTGALFAGSAEGVVPDLMCLGKVLGGGFPISACVGTTQAMGAWGASTGEAIHTQTFLGHPPGCAAALAVLDILERDPVVDTVLQRGDLLASRLQGLGLEVRGRGLMRAVTVPGHALAFSRELLARGFLVLPATDDSLGLLPPVCLTDAQLDAFVDHLGQLL